VLSKLAAESDIASESFELLTTFFGQIPVKKGKDGKYSEQLSKLLQDGFKCIETHYLEFPELNMKASGALLNMLELNFDNFTALNTAKYVVELLDKAIVKEKIDADCVKSLISEGMRLYTVDIIFKRKA